MAYRHIFHIIHIGQYVHFDSYFKFSHNVLDENVNSFVTFSHLKQLYYLLLIIF